MFSFERDCVASRLGLLQLWKSYGEFRLGTGSFRDGSVCLDVTDSKSRVKDSPLSTL